MDFNLSELERSHSRGPGIHIADIVLIAVDAALGDELNAGDLQPGGWKQQLYNPPISYDAIRIRIIW